MVEGNAVIEGGGIDDFALPQIEKPRIGVSVGLSVTRRSALAISDPALDDTLCQRQGQETFISKLLRTTSMGISHHFLK